MSTNEIILFLAMYGAYELITTAAEAIRAGHRASKASGKSAAFLAFKFFISFVIGAELYSFLFKKGEA